MPRTDRRERFSHTADSALEKGGSKQEDRIRRKKDNALFLAKLPQSSGHIEQYQCESKSPMPLCPVPCKTGVFSNMSSERRQRKSNIPLQQPAQNRLQVFEMLFLLCIFS
jgi:hypothetical protein